MRADDQRGAAKPKKKKVFKPSKTQVASAKAQARGYASQGKQVEHAAVKQKRVARKRSVAVHQERAYASLGKHIEKQANVQKGAHKAGLKRTPEGYEGHSKHKLFGIDKLARDSTSIYKYSGKGDPGSRKNWKVDVERTTERQGVKKAQAAAPALKILDQTTRPLHAIAAASDAAIKGKSVTKAAKRGIQNKDKTTFSKVLKHLGAPKAVQKAGGFALDVGLDPTTYVTGGTASLAKKASADALKKAEANALAKGMSSAGAKTVAKQAAKKAAVKAPKSKGVTVKFAGKHVPVVTKATAKAGDAAKKVAAKTPGRVARPVAKSKDIVRDVRPTLKPAGVSEEAHKAARHASRGARAGTARDVQVAEAQARKIQHKVKPEDQAKIVDALERGKIRKLADPKHREIAKRIQDDLKYAKRQRKRAGLSEGEIKHYFPHAREDALKARMGVVADDSVKVKKVARGGRTLGAPESSMRREQKGTIKKLNVEREAKGQSKFSTDVPGVMFNYKADTSRVVRGSKFFRDLAESGRSVRKGKALELGDHEAAYFLGTKGGKYGLHAVEDKEAAKFIKTGEAPHGSSGRYVVLDKRVEQQATQSAKPMQSDSAIGQVFDNVTGKWKRLATATPGFHIRNAIGDTQMAYLGQPGHKLPGNAKAAAKTLKYAGKKEKNPLDLKPVKGNSRIKVGGKDTAVHDFLKSAEDHGVIDSGYIGRELKDLVGAASRRKRLKNRAGATVTRVMRHRENLMRLATYKHALDKGMSPKEAADYSLHHHIDYGDLTQFERKYARRVAPFYTFSARSVPLHAQKLVSNPGKFAQYQKVREELGDPVKNSDMTEFQQRQVGVGKKLGKKLYSFSASLPLTGLNELPTGVTPHAMGAWISEQLKFGTSMLNPAFKIPIEAETGTSTYFREPLKPKQGTLVNAPDWVLKLPKPLQKQLGVVPDKIDKVTGKKVPAWSYKAAYALSQFPGPANLANQLASPGANRRGQNTALKTVSGLTGIKSDLIQPANAQINRLYEDYSRISNRLSDYNKRGITKANAPKAYFKLLADQKHVKDQIHQLSVKRGDKIPLMRKPGRRASGSSKSMGGGFSSSDFGSSGFGSGGF